MVILIPQSPVQKRPTQFVQIEHKSTQRLVIIAVHEIANPSRKRSDRTPQAKRTNEVFGPGSTKLPYRGKGKDKGTILDRDLHHKLGTKMPD